MLQVKELNQYYGGSHILRGVSFEARIGEVTCLLGRNGVGKTTLLKCLMGLIPARSGSVLWQDKNVTHWKPHQRVRAGVAYVPQGRDIFPRLTVEENLLLGLSRFSAPEARHVPDDIYALFPVLQEMKHRRGGDLSGGQQQQLAIGRALASRPQLLILDEPTEGIQPSVIKEIGQVISQLAHRGIWLYCWWSNSTILRSSWPTNTCSCRGAALFKAAMVKIWRPRAFGDWLQSEVCDRAASALSLYSSADHRLPPGLGAHAFYHERPGKNDRHYQRDKQRPWRQCG